MVGAHSEDDWQAQVEEVTALLSIYSEDFRVVACPGLTDAALEQQDADALISLPCPPGSSAPLECEALCHVEVPPGGLQLLLGTRCHADGGCEAAGGGAGADGGMPVGEPVSYLPPIRVQLEMPHCYPSQQAPSVQLHAIWLAPHDTCKLEEQLHGMWEEQGPGMAIVFTWLEWLRTEALQHLGAEGSLCLGQCSDQRAPAGDRQAAAADAPAGAAGDAPARVGGHTRSSGGYRRTSSSTSADADNAVSAGGGDDDGGDGAMAVAMQVLRFHAASESQAFRSGTWRCTICYEDVPGAACVRLPDCGHFYCSSCISTHCQTQLACGAVENMRCPEPSCRLALPPHLLQELLGGEGFEHWEELLLERTLDRMEDVVFCPRCETRCIEDSQHCAQCAGCQYVFCSFCSDSWHPSSEPCLDPDQRLLVLARRKGRGGKADPQREQDLINQMHSLRLVQQTSKRCPSCQMATSKTEGCNKMTCVYCNAAWCWRCERRIEGYDHFRTGGCRLFEQSETDRWNRAMWENQRAHEVERRQIVVQVLGGLAGAQLCRCPVCGQENARQARNNLLRCWACNSHFCAACRGWLRGKVMAHYAPGSACKQHS